VTVLEGLEAAAGLAVYGAGGVPNAGDIRAELPATGSPWFGGRRMLCYDYT
jgi:hypothetical protein